MALPPDLALNTEGREQLRRRVCEIARLDPQDSANGDVGQILRRLLNKWSKLDDRLDKLLDQAFPRGEYSWSETRIGRSSLVDVIAGDYEGGQRGQQVHTQSVNSTGRNYARHLNFVRGDLIEVAVTKLVQLIENKEASKAKARQRNAERRALAHATTVSSVSAEEPTLPLPTSAELIAFIRETLPVEVGQVTPDTNYPASFPRKAEAPLTPSALLQKIIAAKGVSTQLEVYPSLKGMECAYNPATQHTALNTNAYTKHTKQFVADLCHFIKGCIRSELIAPAQAAEALATALGIANVKDNSVKPNIGPVILQFMRKHKLIPSEVL